ncbi:MAG: protein-glutamate O-methyltransferase [Gammaproteobacteria bacterium]|nr:protein-glutamate O-methyltransferase [Gammaproteobacteria bacterium]
MPQPIPGLFQQQAVSTSAYQSIREFIYKEAGIDLGDSKQQLVCSRLNKRLRFHNLSSFDQYADLIQDHKHNNERQMAIDLLTTNETYFFREAGHFETLKTNVLQQHPKSRPFRVWSAASSSGEEAYSIAMVLDDFFGSRVNWEIFGSDISQRIIEKAKRGLYQALRIDAIPENYLQRYCLKGTGEYEGFLLIDKGLRDRTQFAEINLTRPLPDVGVFDVIFLRNVLIYFDNPTKEKIIRSLVSKLRPQGTLYIGHSESLKGMDLPLTLIAPTTYQKP